MNILFYETFLYRLLGELIDWAFGNGNCFYIKAIRFPMFLTIVIPVIVIGIMFDIFMFKND